MTAPKPRGTLERETVREPYKWERGPAWISWVYLVFRQLLAFGDLLGPDGRPSATKLMAFSICSSVLYTAVVNAQIKLALAHKEPPIVNEAVIWTWPMFWLLFLCIAVMFGRWGFDRFAQIVKERGAMLG